jgi:hypothetical protein
MWSALVRCVVSLVAVVGLGASAAWVQTDEQLSQQAAPPSERPVFSSEWEASGKPALLAALRSRCALMLARTRDDQLFFDWCSLMRELGMSYPPSGFTKDISSMLAMELRLGHGFTLQLQRSEGDHWFLTGRDLWPSWSWNGADLVAEPPDGHSSTVVVPKSATGQWFLSDHGLTLAKPEDAGPDYTVLMSAGESRKLIVYDPRKGTFLRLPCDVP